ncbi:esterase E4-like [Photinus pyralis]|uniref:esterase E4-like n=1 Tax=Photinus pyralis TaxID=7054 RepID=UPI0012672E1A|nr:esterase E4-like [Photinus pyralis]XP_031345678.1 esterase E4-like [Photinus pyralis]
MLMKYFLSCVTVLCCTLVVTNASLEIKIEQGVLKGWFDITRKGRIFRSFTGIPFAEPPLEALRFKPPVPAKPWQGVLDATRSHASCPQVNVYIGDFTIKGDEDCLYLNVYAPENAKDHPLPVMFFIHGGGWMCGTSDSELYGAQTLLDQEVVLVTTNYRLGALGFMSTGDLVLPGNNGLKDQNLALKWAKNNIRQFGGNPDKITIFGQSAGAASTHFHTLSPLSRDLISGAIIQSGSALAPWAISLKPLDYAKRLAGYVNCPNHSSEAIVECMRTVDPYEIVQKEQRLLEYGYDPMIPFKPVVEPSHEGAFLTEEPAVIIRSRKSARVPLMTGFTTEDGAIKSSALFKDEKLIEELNSDFNRIAPLIFVYDQATYNTTGLSEKIRKFYLGDRPIDESSKAPLTNAFTDTWFYVATDSVIRMHTNYCNNPVYFYLFGYQGGATFTTVFKHPEDQYNYGSCHCDELIYLFRQGYVAKPREESEEDKRMTDVIVALWTNFARTGNPTPPNDKLLTIKWNPVSSKKHEYYLIDKHGRMSMGENWEPGRLSFARKIKFNSRWNEVRDEL